MAKLAGYVVLLSIPTKYPPLVLSAYVVYLSTFGLRPAAAPGYAVILSNSTYKKTLYFHGAVGYTV